MFKVGDKVKCIKGSNWYPHLLTEGRVYTVQSIFPQMETCKLVDGENFSWDDGRFVLATSGDPVPVTKTETAFTLIRYAQEKLVKQEPTFHIIGQPAIYCRCCGVQATFKQTNKGHYLGNQLNYPVTYSTPDLMGWMVIDYPFKDPRHHTGPEGTISSSEFKEKSKVCPKCAVKVMGTLVHLATPGASR